MKIGIMTWFSYHNYGTALQVTALAEKIKSLGHEVELINYEPRPNPVEKANYNITAFIMGRIFNKFKRLFCPVYNYYSSSEREEKFNSFIRENIALTRECNTLSELEDIAESFDAIICGSDQIWSPLCFDSHYFLDFVHDSSRKIAYAPSINPEHARNLRIKEKIIKLAQDFDYISLRESEPAKIFSQWLNRDVKNVLDPTMFLDSENWNKYIRNLHKGGGGYLLVYMLGCNERHWRKVYNVAAKMGLDVKIIPVFKRDFQREGCINYPVGPVEFLDLFKNAKFVCTDSFHGMVFSIIFHVNFIEFRRFKDNDPRNQNFRIFNLADLLALNDRISDSLPDNISINFQEVDSRLQKLRADSLSFLNESLNHAAITPRKKFLNQVLQNHSLCCGCGACESVCPVDAVKIIMNQDGFYEAVINQDSCISCGKCKKVCPFENCSGIKCESGTLFSYKDNDNKILLESSSGGFAHRLALLANNNGFDVCGCVFNRDNARAEHIIIAKNHPEEICKLQGSKYIQSNFSGVMTRIKNSEKILVFGTPCQIAGVRNLAGNESNNLLLIDLICHGVPTAKLYNKYLEYLSTHKGLANNIKTVFRYKHSPGQWRERYIYNEDSSGKNFCAHQSKDPFFLMFEHGPCYSRACYECPYRDKSPADIRIGDYWGEKFIHDKTGVSIVEIMTGKGLDFLNTCKISRYGEFIQQEITDYINCQQMKNLHVPIFYDDLIRDLSEPGKSLINILRDYDIYLRQNIREYQRFTSSAKKILRQIIHK